MKSYFRYAAIGLLMITFAHAALAKTELPVGYELPISTSDYDHQLAEVEVDVNSVIASGKFVSSDILNRALSDLAGVVRCPVASQGTIITVDNRPLRSTLTRIETTLPVANRRQTMEDVVAQIAVIRSELTVDDHTPAAEREANSAKQLLRGNDFSSEPVSPQTASQKKLDEWGDNFVKWLRDLIRKLHGPDIAPSPLKFDVNAARIILYVVLGIAATALIYLLIRMIVSINTSRQYSSSTLIASSSLAINEAEQALVQTRDYAKLMLLATQMADAGEYRNAYRLVYLATLVLLDWTGHLKINVSRTNWEYLRQIKSNGHVELYDLKFPLTSEFDRIWYGFGYVDQYKFDEAAELYNSILRLVIQPTSVTGIKKAIA